MRDHRVTKTKLFSLLKKKEAKEGFDAAEISSRVSAVVDDAWPVLQQVARKFPLYTLHDPGHSFHVAEHMAALVPRETLKQLNSIELSVLLYSAYLHDIGMAASEDEFYKWLASDDYSSFLGSQG